MSGRRDRRPRPPGQGCRRTDGDGFTRRASAPPGKPGGRAATPAGAKSTGPGRLRIVGGAWRGRRLPVPDAPGLRPTPDRVRETLFNWLAPSIAGARCLDLFAGSGALGLEAASRGAARVVLVERAPAVARRLRANLETLDPAGIGTRIAIVEADALAWLAQRPLEDSGPHRAFDLVFLDPPFDAGLLTPACARLADSGRLAPGARIYLETAARTGLPPLPPGWTLLKERTAGEVRFALAQADGASASPGEHPLAASAPPDPDQA